jgi:chemotaxis protein histidine kinase CheA
MLFVLSSLYLVLFDCSNFVQKEGFFMELGLLLKKLPCSTVDLTRSRFIDDAEFYQQITSAMFCDPGFELLGEQLKARDFSAAFKTAHTLKGIITNCGITPLSDASVYLVDLLREEKPDPSALEAAYGELITQRDAMRLLFESVTAQ